MTQITAKIGFIGGGNMATAIINGLIAGGVIPSNIMVSDPNDASRDFFNQQGMRTTTDSAELIDFAEVIVLAIKPQLFASVLPEFAGLFKEGKLVVSIAAGITVATIEELIQYDNIVRCMPNTPALIQQGATGLFASDKVKQNDRITAERILSATGLVIWVDVEDKLHAVTAVSGSAPAYFFYVMESMIEAGIELGLTQEQATQLTLQTAFGASKMAIESDDTPTELRQKVTSPNGTTHAAIESMKANGLAKIISEGMQACVLRSEEMARGK
ncbi:MAG: pyrroline-5-carboxylate reductase [Pseudomonadales bacterium]|nr:MAG: pyrroline-5-carboxylate reductase [Pseudomonadales bacterium]